MTDPVRELSALVSNSQKMRTFIRCIVFAFLQVLNAAETGGAQRNWYDDHGLKCIASNGKPCLFPFQSNGKVEKHQHFITCEDTRFNNF